MQIVPKRPTTESELAPLRRMPRGTLPGMPLVRDANDSDDALVCHPDTMCPRCQILLVPEHAHSRCPKCGYRDSCCF
jgi:hypothetical protein